MASLGSNTFQIDYFLAEYGLHFLIMRERGCIFVMIIFLGGWRWKKKKKEEGKRGGAVLYSLFLGFLPYLLH